MHEGIAQQPKKDVKKAMLSSVKDRCEEMTAKRKSYSYNVLAQPFLKWAGGKRQRATRLV